MTTWHSATRQQCLCSTPSVFCAAAMPPLANKRYSSLLCEEYCCPTMHRVTMQQQHRIHIINNKQNPFSLHGRRSWGWEVLTHLKYVRRVRVCFDPLKCHILSFKTAMLLDSSAWFTSSWMKDLCQKWMAKLIFEGAWYSLMAWPDWPWLPYRPILQPIYSAVSVYSSYVWRFSVDFRVTAWRRRQSELS